MWHCATRLLDYIMFNESDIIMIYLHGKHGIVVTKIVFILKVAGEGALTLRECFSKNYF